ncbi:MAG: InlB B-repeat-containing protein [Proteobacteria bacterium]|nr:InlB B-repeat-containing protein [Pseudomonadota bacterium]
MTGGDVTAQGGYDSAGIGGGRNGAVDTITINGNAVVDAKGGNSSGTAYGGGAGIGSGGGDSGGATAPNSGTITIGGTANVTATGGNSPASSNNAAGAGIGTGGAGQNGTQGTANVTITTSGTVSATGGTGNVGGNGAAVGTGGTTSGAGTPLPGYHSIAALAGANGEISPSGNIIVPANGSKTFTITPDSGYGISQVLINGTNNPAAVASGSYLFSSVTGNHSIAATFLSDTDAVDTDKTALTWDSIKGTNSAENNVTANLVTLPTSGASGTTILWSSSNTAVVSNTGAVTRPSFGSGDANVTLTATISKGTVSDTVVFNLIVKELAPTDAQAVAADKATLTWSVIQGTNTAENNVTANLAALPLTGANGTTISWLSSNTSVVSNTGVVTRPSFGSGDANVILTATIIKNAASGTVVFNLTVKQLVPTSVAFRATQVGGIANTVDSTGIVLTFFNVHETISQPVIGLTAGDITITDLNGSVTKGNLTGSGDTWTIALTHVAAQGDVEVDVNHFGNYTIVNPPRHVAVYRNMTPPFTITFNPNGGTVTPTRDLTGTNDTLSSLPTPTGSGGYRFDGWFTAISGGTQVTTSYVFTADTTIYARWTYLGGGGGSGVSIPVLHPAGLALLVLMLAGVVARRRHQTS